MADSSTKEGVLVALHNTQHFVISCVPAALQSSHLVVDAGCAAVTTPPRVRLIAGYNERRESSVLVCVFVCQV